MSGWLVWKFGSYIFRRPQVLIEPMPFRIVPTTLPRRPGVVVVSPVVYESRSIQIEDVVYADSIDGLDEIKNKIIAEVGAVKALYFRNSRHLNCQIQNVEYQYERGTKGTMMRVVFDFFAADPYVYGETYRTPTVHVTSTPTIWYPSNAGNAEARTICTIQANQDIAALTIENLSYIPVLGYSLKFTLTNIPNGFTIVVNAIDSVVYRNGAEDFTGFSGDFPKLLPGENTISIQGTTDALVEYGFNDTYYGL